MADFKFTGAKFASDVLNALGVGTKYATGFTLECRVAELPRLTVTQLIPDDAGRVSGAIESHTFRLVPADADEEIVPLTIAAPSPDAEV